jgi:alginate O-acetyltransferase complex protein AlgI
MPFNSISFIFFFISSLPIYYLLSDRYKKYFLIFLSWLFYSFGNFLSIITLIGVTLITYFSVNHITKRKPNVAVYSSVLIIILALVTFKYIPFVYSDVVEEWLIINPYFNFLFIPIGISFYSLQAISLILDVNNCKYRGNLTFDRVAFFLSFFPQSISGPIHRPNELIDQYEKPRKFNADNLIKGLKIMLTGYTLKLLVADKIALLITPILNNPIKEDGLSILFSSLLFSLQIYFDFFGYSLIAIGVGRALGFKINKNFNSPYSATSFQEFWHRWHISLSTWFRDYVYFYLGGRKSKTYILFALSILVTFILSGLWHGITLNFIIWGLVHVLLYLIEDLLKRGKKSINEYSSVLESRAFKGIQWCVFFLLITLTWMIFRSDNLTILNQQIAKIFNIYSWSFHSLAYNFFGSAQKSFLLCLILILIFMYEFRSFTYSFIQNEKDLTIRENVIITTSLLLIILFGDIGTQQFLYFKF